MRTYVGVDIGGTKMQMVAGSEDAFFHRRIPTGPSLTPEKIRDALHGFIASLPFSVAHVGMTIPGMIREDREVVLADGLFGITGMTAESLEGDGFDVTFLGDLSAAARYELPFYKPTETVLVVMVGTAIAMSGQRGGDPPVMIGSDIGYAPIRTESGVYMLNELVGGYALLAARREPADEYIARVARCVHEGADEDGNVPGSITADEFLARLGRGEERETQKFDDAVFYLGLALSDFIVNFFPDVIVLGGGTMQYPGFFERSVEVCRRYTFPAYGDRCRIVRTHGDPRFVAAEGARLTAKDRAEKKRGKIC